MQKYGWLIVLGVVLLICSPGAASAHVLETDGLIGAVLHINPSDQPRAGGPSGLHFDIRDKSGTFALEKCSCIVSVTKNGRQLSGQSLPGSSFVSYVFPEEDVYQVSLDGAPKGGAQFEKFHLQWDVRVEAMRGTKSTSGFVLTITKLLLSISVLVGMIGVATLLPRKRNKQE